jgi:hypothetical protein
MAFSNQMKLLLLPSLLLLGVAGFGIVTRPLRPLSAFRRSAATNAVIDVEATVTPAKAYLLEVAQRLNDEYGVFVIDSKAIDELESAVKDLEATATLFGDNYQKDFLGEWTLLCTAATASSSTSSSATSFLGKGIDTSLLPFFNEGKDFRNALNKQLLVKQVIRSENGIYVDRVDHVLEYQPPNTLQEILKNLPKELSVFNINPLHVSQGKLTLIHKANVESVTPLRTKLTLQSVVLSVAGTSQYLDPNGKDILGINVPMTEFLNTGIFETTYMDKELRVSRGKVGLVEQLRVFIRAPTAAIVEDDPLNENVDVDVGGARAETEEAVTDSFFDDTEGDLTPSA